VIVIQPKATAISAETSYSGTPTLMTNARAPSSRRTSENASSTRFDE
jgi:hypothetical protein